MALKVINPGQGATANIKPLEMRLPQGPQIKLADPVGQAAGEFVKAVGVYADDRQKQRDEEDLTTALAELQKQAVDYQTGWQSTHFGREARGAGSVFREHVESVATEMEKQFKDRPQVASAFRQRAAQVSFQGFARGRAYDEAQDLDYKKQNLDGQLANLQGIMANGTPEQIAMAAETYRQSLGAFFPGQDHTKNLAVLDKTLALGSVQRKINEGDLTGASDALGMGLRAGVLSPDDVAKGQSLIETRIREQVTAAYTAGNVAEGDKLVAQATGGSGLGRIAIGRESGGNPATVSPDNGGSFSYGLYQFNSQKGGTAHTFMTFIKAKHPALYEALGGGKYVVGSKNFNAAFKEAASGALKDEMITAQREHFEASYLAPIEAKLKGSDLYAAFGGNEAFREMMVSTAIQHGPGGANGILRKAWAGVDKSADRQEQLEQLIHNTYAIRGDRSSFPSFIKEKGEWAWQNLRKRFPAEERQVLALARGQGAGVPVSAETQAKLTAAQVQAHAIQYGDELSEKVLDGSMTMTDALEACKKLPNKKAQDLARGQLSRGYYILKQREHEELEKAQEDVTAIQQDFVKTWDEKGGAAATELLTEAQRKWTIATATGDKKAKRVLEGINKLVSANIPAVASERAGEVQRRFDEKFEQDPEAAYKWLAEEIRTAQKRADESGSKADKLYVHSLQTLAQGHEGLRDTISGRGLIAYRQWYDAEGFSATRAERQKKMRDFGLNRTDYAKAEAYGENNGAAYYYQQEHVIQLTKSLYKGGISVRDINRYMDALANDLKRTGKPKTDDQIKAFIRNLHDTKGYTDMDPWWKGGDWNTKTAIDYKDNPAFRPNVPDREKKAIEADLIANNPWFLFLSTKTKDSLVRLSYGKGALGFDWLEMTADERADIKAAQQKAERKEK